MKRLKCNKLIVIYIQNRGRGKGRHGPLVPAML
jgi:hypothetical protein